MNTKCCSNCWFYCHGNSKCYAPGVINKINDSFLEEAAAEIKSPEDFCYRYAFDSLEEWEREEI